MSDNEHIAYAVIQEQIKNINEKIDGLHRILQDNIKNSDKRYAPKWAADVVKGMMVLILTTVMLAILKLVLIPSASALFYHITTQ